MTDLKPCPHCGHKLERYQQSQSSPPRWYHIAGPEDCPHAGVTLTLEKVAAWNRRAAPETNG